MSNSHPIIGRSPIITQGKIVVQLIGENLPKIGSSALIQEKGKYIKIGEIIEVIGSTKNPWLVISARKDKISHLNEETTLFSDPQYDKKKGGRKSQFGRKKLPSGKRD